jgi:hypothetical protein
MQVTMQKDSAQFRGRVWLRSDADPMDSSARPEPVSQAETFESLALALAGFLGVVLLANLLAMAA